MQRYIMKNRERFDLPMSHGQYRHEYIIYDESGAELDRLNVTPSTASWLANSQGLKPSSPAHWYSTQQTL